MKKKLKISKKFNKSQDWEILEDDIPMMPDGGRTPIKGTKEQYQAYQDSLDLYNNALIKNLQSEFKYENPPVRTGNYISYDALEDFIGEGNQFDDINVNKRFSDKENREKEWKKEGDMSVIDNRNITKNEFFKSQSIKPVGFDIYNSGYDPNNKFYASVYKEPVQPIIYQPEDTRVPQNNNGTMNVVESNKTPWGARMTDIPKGRNESDYRIETYSYNGNRLWTYVPNEQPINIQSKEGLLESNPINLGDINPIPFEQGTFFSRERQNQELDSKQFGRKGKKDYFDKKTGKLLGTYQNGGRIPKAGDGKNMGYSWSTQQAPTQQVVGSVENTQTSKPSIQPFQKGYVNPKTMTSKTGEEGLGDDLGGMMVTAALAPGSLPFRASSRLGRVALGAGELANPISGFRGLNSMSSSVDDIGEQLTRATNELPPLNTSSNIYRGSDLDIARYNNMTENINTTNIDPSLQDFHNSIRDRVLNTYNNLPSDEFGFTIHTPPRKQVLKKNIIESSIDAIKNPKKTVARLQYDYERGALNPKSLYYNQFMDILPGDKIGKHSLFGDAEKGFKETMNKSAEVSAGRMFGEASLSSDSFPLLLAQLRRKAKDVDITHTGEFVPLNNFGNKSKSLLTAAKNPEEGQESILKYVNEHIDKLNKEAGSKIPYAKVINRKVHIPYILAEKKGATLTDKLQRNKTVGLLGTGAATLAGIKPVFDYADNYNQEKFEKDYNEYIKNKPLQNWEQYPLQQKKSGGKVKLKPKSSDWEIFYD